MPDNISVARRTQQSSDCPGGVAVIHREPFSLPVSSTAYMADAALVLVDGPVFFLGDPVRLPDPSSPRRSGSDSALGPVVGSAAWSGVGCFASSGNSFVNAIYTTLPTGFRVVGRVPLPLSRMRWHFEQVLQTRPLELRRVRSNSWPLMQ